MKSAFAHLALAAGLVASSATFAQAPAAAPSGSTGLCKDGSYTSNETKKGACSGHKGVKDWFAADAAPAKEVAAPAKESAPRMDSAAVTAAVATVASLPVGEFRLPVDGARRICARA